MQSDYVAIVAKEIDSQLSKSVIIVTLLLVH